MFLQKYKCDTDMFDKIPTIKIGQMMLRGLYPNELETEAKYYNVISSDSLVKKYLPGAYTENEEEALDKIKQYINRTLSGASVLFCIAAADKKPIGYILCNSPIMNFENSSEQIGEWTIDFWLHKGARNNGIMAVSIQYILNHMQKMKIPKVYA